MIFQNFVNTIEESTDYTADITIESVGESKYEPSYEGVLMHVLESEQNWSKLEEATHLSDCETFITSVNEAESSEKDSKTKESWFNKIVEFLKSIATKFVQGCVSFINKMKAVVIQDKAFIKQFEGQKLQFQQFAIKGYKYTANKISLADAEGKLNSVIDKTFQGATVTNEENAKKSVDFYKENKATIENQMRGAVVGKDSTTSKEFGTELAKVLRNGQEKPADITIKSGSISEQFGFVKSHKDNVDQIEASLKSFKNATNKTIGLVETMKKENKKDKKGVMFQYSSSYISALKTKLTILMTVNGALMSALNGRRSQAKAICYRALSASKAKHESVDLTNESFTSDDLFGNITME